MILELPAEHKGGPIFTLLERDEDVHTYDNNSSPPPFLPGSASSNLSAVSGGLHRY